jgi:hypothetical protein
LAALPEGESKITFSVNCDLTSFLDDRYQISVTGAQPKDFNVKDAHVSSVTRNAVVVVLDGQKLPTNPPPKYLRGGTVTGVNCPPPGDAFNVTFSVAPIPISRGYLYLLKNAFYSDTVNVTIGIDGMLSSSDTSSVQQITAILTELAQVAGALAPGFKITGVEPRKPEAPQDPRDKCYKTISDFLRLGPYYDSTVWRRADWSIPLPSRDKPEVALRLQLSRQRGITPTGQVRVNRYHPGLVAFFPIPAIAKIWCDVPDAGSALLSPPTVVPLYIESHFLDPQRDFLTNPQDTFTFNSGIITGHKYVAQSPAKTIVDTVTAPIRAMMPSVTVTQTTQVQSVPGKPEQTTTSTGTQTAPSKGP